MMYDVDMGDSLPIALFAISTGLFQPYVDIPEVRRSGTPRGVIA